VSGQGGKVGCGEQDEERKLSNVAQKGKSLPFTAFLAADTGKTSHESTL
jgi:hypothetical protein